MQKTNRNQCEPYPEFNLSTRLLKHQQQMLQFLYFTSYDIILEQFQLKHASYISSTKRGYPVQQFSKGEQIQRHFKMISQKLHIRLMRDDIDLDKRLDRLQILWHSRNVPMFHRYYFEKYLYSTFVKSVEELIENQQKLIRQQKHVFYTIFKTINARQACLRQLKKHLAQLTSQDVHEYLHIARQRFYNEKKKNENEKYLKKGYRVKQNNQNDNIQQAKISKCKLQFFSDNFNHLSKLTLYCIDQIFKWKEYIQSLTHDVKKKRERVEYFYFQDNYFLKILSDTSFIKVSFLQRFYKFAPKNDPFLLWPVLAFQKSQIKQLDNQLLKHIFMPQEEQLSEIMNKMESLSEEYRWNIRSRKNYDVNVLKKSLDIQNQRKRVNTQSKLQMQPASNLVLKKLEGTVAKRSQSLKTFRIRQQTKQKQIIKSTNKDKILIEFKNSPKKRATWLPGATLKTVLQTQTSPLKHSVILQKNKVNPLLSAQITDDLLKSLKQQVIRKIKIDFAANIPSNKTSKDQALQMYINTKINEALQGIFPYQPEKQLKKPIQLTSFRIEQAKLSSEISSIIKHTVQLYKEMQYSQSDLMKKIQQSPYVYFLKATLGDQYLATLILTLDRQTQEYKTMKTLYIGFNDVSQLQMLMVETAKFMQKYDNAFQTHFPFFHPVINQPIKQLLSTLQQNLTKKQTQIPCIVAQKQIYSNISEVRYIFKRQNKNVNYHPNRYPLSIHFKFSLIHSEKKLFLQRSKIDKSYGSKISYDFLLSQLLRKVFDSQSLNILKQKKFTDQRFKQILNNMLQLQKGTQTVLGEKTCLKFIEAKNISELNSELSKQNEQYPYLQLSDTVKTGNKIHSLSLSFIFGLPYQVIKTIVGDNNEMYYKISIREEINCTRFRETVFYKLPLKDERISRIDKTKPLSNEKYLIVFDAQEYLKSKYPDLTTYLIDSFIGDKKGQTKKFLINQLWLPMLRYPEKYQQREELYLSTNRLNDLQQLKEQLFIGQFFQWFCDMQIQNGIIYPSMDQQKFNGKIVIRKPLGMAVVTEQNQNMFILYGRVFNK